MAKKTAQPPHSQQRWLDAWYGPTRWTLWLMPVMWIFIFLSACRRFWLRRYCAKAVATPVIVIGNISVGGTGKTPLLIAVVKRLQQQGFTPGVISRGYGSKAPQYPYLVNSMSTATEAGDEPMVIFQQTQCAISLGATRIASAKLLEDEGCDILISDDGLQHYRLKRDIEIAVVDGQRGLGNGFRLPVGPLREAVARLKTVDWIVVNTPTKNFRIAGLEHAFYIPMEIEPARLIPVNSAATPVVVPTGPVHGVAGIGHPERFYQTLSAMQFEVIRHNFPDHHQYLATDFDFGDDLPIVMTEKDAVKCRAFARPNWFYLPISAQLPDLFWQALTAKINGLCNQRKTFQKPFSKS